MKKTWIWAGLLLTLAACDRLKGEAPGEQRTAEEVRQESRGKVTGPEGWVVFGGEEKGKSGAEIGVNGFLWRATLDSLSFMPLASADPFGGVIITDWFEDPKTPGERYKVNAFILDRELRADAIKVKVFKQTKDAGGWKDAEVNAGMPRDIEDTILTRARAMRVAQLEK